MGVYHLNNKMMVKNRNNNVNEREVEMQSKRPPSLNHTNTFVWILNCLTSVDVIKQRVNLRALEKVVKNKWNAKSLVKGLVAGLVAVVKVKVIKDKFLVFFSFLFF